MIIVTSSLSRSSVFEMFLFPLKHKAVFSKSFVFVEIKLHFKFLQRSQCGRCGPFSVASSSFSFCLRKAPRLIIELLSRLIQLRSTMCEMKCINWTALLTPFPRCGICRIPNSSLSQRNDPEPICRLPLEGTAAFPWSVLRAEFAELILGAGSLFAGYRNGNFVNRLCKEKYFVAVISRV